MIHGRILMDGGRKGGGCLTYETYEPNTQIVLASDVQTRRLVALDGNRLFLTDDSGEPLEGGMVYDYTDY